MIKMNKPVSLTRRPCIKRLSDIKHAQDLGSEANERAEGEHFDVEEDLVLGFLGGGVLRVELFHN